MYEVLLRTVLFGAKKHAKQTRDGANKIPYINHPIEVAHETLLAGGSLAAACAAILHDTKEDAGVSDQEILDLYPVDPAFGKHVLQIVNEHTDPPGLDYAEIKARETKMMRNGDYLPETRLVIIADQLCNMRDLVRNPPGWGKGEEETYIEQMKVLIDAGRKTSLYLEQQFDHAYAEAVEFYYKTS